MIQNRQRPIPDWVGDAEIRTVLDHLNEGFDRTASALRCPRHGTQPRVQFGADRDEGIFTEALVCCPELDEMVAQYVDRHLIEHPIGDWQFGGANGL